MDGVETLRSRSLYTFGLVSVLSAVAVSTSGADLQVTASVDRTVVGLNQQFTLSIEMSGEGANAAPDPELPDLTQFAAYIGSGSSSSIQLINGRMSVSKTISYTFVARQVGKFQIGPAKITYRGKVYETQPISIEITQAPPQPQPSQVQPGQAVPSVQAESSIEGNLFVKALVNKRRVYQNEPVIVTFRIYTRVNVTQYGISKLPNTAGFWAEEFPIPQQPGTHEEIINGRKFIVADIRKMALFPTNPGKMTIDPIGVECDVRVQDRRRSRDFFDSFFDDPFFGRTVRKSLLSDPIQIEVLPLPIEGKPANFSGAVGSYNLSTTVDKETAKTNEAVTLTVKISGSGNIKVLPQPEVVIPPDFEKYEPKVSESINRQGETISGTKTFEYVLIPRFPGLQKIKPVEFSFFDLKTKSYRTLQTPELTIDVSKGGEEFVSLGPGLSKEEVRLLGQDIRFIKKSPADFSKIGSRFYRSAGFIFLVIFPILLVVGAVGYRNHLDKLSANVAYARDRQANQMAMRRLRKAKHLLDENTQKEYFAEVSRALMGFLGDKLNIAEAGIITDEVEARLRARGVDGEVLEQYLACLRTCDYQRFAPSTAKKEEMNVFFEQAKKAIVDLERVV